MKFYSDLAHPRAQAMLIMLVDALEGYDEDYPQVDINTSAFHNGREQAICLSVSDWFGSDRKYIIFGVARGGDEIFVDTWEESGLPDLNPPTTATWPEWAMDTRKLYMGLDVPVADIASMILLYATQLEATRETELAKAQENAAIVEAARVSQKAKEARRAEENRIKIAASIAKDKADRASQREADRLQKLIHQNPHHTK